MTGECLHTLQHDHIVHAIAFPHAVNPCVVVTGGRDRKLRIWDFSAQTNGVNGISTGVTNVSTGFTSVRQFELGAGVHTGTIKSIVWNTDPNVITTASEDKKIRWWDLRANSPIISRDVMMEPTSMQLTTRDSSNVISVTAGKKVYLYNGAQHGTLTKEIDMDHEVVSAAVDTKTNTLITGSASDTWVHVYDLIQGRETCKFSNPYTPLTTLFFYSVVLRCRSFCVTCQALTDFPSLSATMKGHHGPVWTICYSPDGKIIGTGSEDGTIKLWKAGKEPYGLWKN
jgi:serine-threonine kinase receptor-associated protein